MEQCGEKEPQTENKLVIINSKEISKNDKDLLKKKLDRSKKTERYRKVIKKPKNKSLSFSSLIRNSIKKINTSGRDSHRKFNLFPTVQKISITINNNSNTVNNRKKKEISSYITTNDKRQQFSSINSVNISLSNSIVCNNGPYPNASKNGKCKTNKNIIRLINKKYSITKIQTRIIHNGLDPSKLINDVNFDIFKLKDIIGYDNILPYFGRIILEHLGLIDEEILSLNKLDPFLISIKNQYLQNTLYHNSLHGTDVTHSCYIFFSHSNAEKIAKTNVLDLLSVFIAALGHDVGHPGLTNTFHINDSTDIAITYNDVSVLENFHASTLFKTIRKTETNIFEKLTTIDYKLIRKRMISEILATDMANHGKVISLIKSKICFNDTGKNIKFNLLSGNEQTKNEEQQSLLDFIIHLSDLAHNTKIFDISLKWVELLSEEFWLQGDIEKKKNLPVSFLCDRESTNVPKSQIGFISGFIIPSFECLTSIFPNLGFTLDNANDNLKQWQNLANQGRMKGWTPTKKEPLLKRTITTNKNGHLNFGTRPFKSQNIEESKINKYNLLNLDKKERDYAFTEDSKNNSKLKGKKKIKKVNNGILSNFNPKSKSKKIIDNKGNKSIYSVVNKIKK